MAGSTTGQKLIHRSAEQWRELIAAWRASGKVCRIWCQEQGISRESLRRWNKRLRHSALEAPLVEIARRPSLPSAASATIRVRIARVGELEVCGAVSEEILRDLLRLMRGARGVR